MKKICASLVVLLVLSGCGYKGGSEFLEMHDKSSIQKELPLNKITKQEIIAKFRKPNDESI
ncbi:MULTISPECIES: hypothetical protein [unclassified Campylobacter]|uniref:hypothetical protein n=1 Tax=unclassified Campylobacter TaxID=2593542 RepID=UPI001237C2B3|nr:MULTISPECIES: hypothetical protein [unclassified Campylobacter]KAA6226384.1 hypothetical protein FMM57_06265 [Campylobacter sp. LR286c]KAA6226578.1 hypothetical protein FMM54_03970 [Campylobacter sp. LR185c]KAA6226875.1 hypothetical protein FMM55_04830 [Campylobacter sp. LR196d]KAA6230313.1 hypothetical protein FMM58_06465 [Campylobacter sp. LR291e]KAA6233834.1 hypothetical protein FMM56_02685 [Campylobacter sp. LR264d]